MFEIPQARRRTRPRGFLEVVGHHVAARWQIYAAAAFVLMAGGVILWAYAAFPPAGKGA